MKILDRKSKLMACRKNLSLRGFFSSSAVTNEKVTSSNDQNKVAFSIHHSNNKIQKINLDEVLILKLASKKRFVKLASVLLSEYYESAWHSAIPEETMIQKKDTDDTSRVSDSSAGEESDSTMLSPASLPLLHQVLEHRPPLAVVDVLCNLLEQQKQAQQGQKRSTCPEDMIDARGRNPLHIAVIQGCELAVIQRLLEGSNHSARVIVNLGPPRPACCVDYLGRTPLHWACANPQGHFGKKKKKTTLFDFFTDRRRKRELKASIDRQCKVVELLLQDSPKVIDIKDNNGQTPLDLAYEKDADPEIFRLLIIAARTLVGNTQNHQGNSKKLMKEIETDALPNLGVSPPPPQPLYPKCKSTRQLNSGFHERRKKMVNKKFTDILDPIDWDASFYSLDVKKLKPNLFQPSSYHKMLDAKEISKPQETFRLPLDNNLASMNGGKQPKVVQIEGKEQEETGESSIASEVVSSKDKDKRSWNLLDLIVDWNTDSQNNQQNLEPDDDISSIGSEGVSVCYRMSRKIEDQIFLL